MKQTGTFHVYEIKNSQRVVSPIPNAFIYFVQNNSIKLTVKTDDKGKYSFDLPLGEYTVVSSSEGGIEQLLANGSKFILNAQSKVTAFEEWVNAPSADVDTALLKRFKELAKIAEDAAREANEVLAQLEDNSIGEGEWTRKTYVDDEIAETKTYVDNEIAEIPKPDMSEYRKLDNHRFDQGWLAIKAVDSGGAVLNFECATGFVRGNIIVSKDDGMSFRQFKEGDPLPLSWNMPLKSGRLVVDSDLGDASKRNITTNTYGTQVGRVLTYGYGGLGRQGVSIGTYNWSNPPGFNGFQYEGSANTTGNPADGSSYAINLVAENANYAHQIGAGIAENELRFRNNNNGTWRPWNTLYHTGNTTVDSNGFIKKASPIIRLFNDQIETNEQFPEDPIFERIGEGTYKISKTLGLAQEGWTYEKPRGSDGNPYFRVLVKKTEDGCIISVHDEYDSIEEATITDIDGNTRKINKVVKVLSQARDIKPHERWIDLRFHEEPREEIEPSEVVQ